MSDACTEAEIFAMNLLMPERMVYEQCLKLVRADIERAEWPQWLSKLFGVPEDKARLRLKELRI